MEVNHKMPAKKTSKKEAKAEKQAPEQESEGCGGCSECACADECCN